VARGEVLEYELPKRTMTPVVAQQPTLGTGRFASLPVKKEPGFGRTASLNKTPQVTAKNAAVEGVIAPAGAGARPGEITNDPKRIAETAAFLANDAQTALGARPQMTEAIQDASTPQATAAVSAENVAVNTPTQVNSGYGAYAKELSDQSQAVMNQPNQASIASDGTNLSSGAMAIGAGIVSRGMANRAKQFSGMASEERTDNIQAQNAETNSFGARSQAAERLKESARQDLTTDVDVTGKKLEQEQILRLNELQSQFLTEKDPAKREAISTQLTAITGKSADKFQPITGKDELGNTTYLGAFDQRNGTFQNQSTIAAAGQNSVPAAPQGAIDKLKANPALAESFKAKYGYLPA
jgi:hypothetical protein